MFCTHTHNLLPQARCRFPKAELSKDHISIGSGPCESSLRRGSSLPFTHRDTTHLTPARPSPAGPCYRIPFTFNSVKQSRVEQAQLHSPQEARPYLHVGWSATDIRPAPVNLESSISDCPLPHSSHDIEQHLPSMRLDVKVRASQPRRPGPILPLLDSFEGAPNP